MTSQDEVNHEMRCSKCHKKIEKDFGYFDEDGNECCQECLEMDEETMIFMEGFQDA